MRTIPEGGPAPKTPLCVLRGPVFHGGRFFLFYGGAYNNAPQQIGGAVRDDGLVWRRLSDEPFLPHGRPGAWNASEAGYPFVFIAPAGRTWLFFQGNSDNGETWYLSRAEIGWRDGLPVLENAPCG